MSTTTPAVEPRPTCGHPRPTFLLRGALYCLRCAPLAWQAFLHAGHPDEPASPPVR